MRVAQRIYLVICLLVFSIVMIVFTLLWQQKSRYPADDILFLASESYEAFYCLSQVKADLLHQAPARPTASAHCNQINLYRYDFRTGTSHAISQADAAKLTLVATVPDEFLIRPSVSRDPNLLFYFFSNTVLPDLLLVHGHYQKELNLPDTLPFKKYYSLQFIAWITRTPTAGTTS